MCCRNSDSSKGKLTVGYQCYTAISSLFSALFCAYALGTNNLKAEYDNSQTEECKNIWYYLFSMSIISGIVGLFLCGYLMYTCLCSVVCKKAAPLDFSCKRCIFLAGYVGLNFWGYFVAIFTPEWCFSNLKIDYPKLFGAFILYNTIFSLNFIYVIILAFNRLCKKNEKGLLEVHGSVNDLDI